MNIYGLIYFALENICHNLLLPFSPDEKLPTVHAVSSLALSFTSVDLFLCYTRIHIYYTLRLASFHVNQDYFVVI